jgi:hypothetical protein
MSNSLNGARGPPVPDSSEVNAIHLPSGEICPELSPARVCSQQSACGRPRLRRADSRAVRCRQPSSGSAP